MWSPPPRPLWSLSTQRCVSVHASRARSTKQGPHVCTRARQTVRHALFTDDGKKVITGADDNILRVWDLASSSCTKEIKLTGTINTLELSTKNNMLTTVADKSVTFFNAETYELRHSHTFDNPLQGASLHPDGSMFVAVRITPLHLLPVLHLTRLGICHFNVRRVAMTRGCVS